MKVDRPANMKFRNDHGEVHASLIFEEGFPSMNVGFSCCNPKDMNTTSRKDKVFKHRKASTGRVIKKPLKVPLPQPLEEIPEDQRCDVVRTALVAFISKFEEHNMGLRLYGGEVCKSEFRQWLKRFAEELRADD